MTEDKTVIYKSKHIISQSKIRRHDDHGQQNGNTVEYNRFDIISLKIDIDSCGEITYIPRITSSLNIEQSIKYSREKLIEKSINDNEIIVQRYVLWVIIVLYEIRR